MIDFTNCKELPNDYGGADKKKKILYNDEVWMLKFSDAIDSDLKNPFNTSYSNNVFSEYLGSKIYNSVGIRAQETLLGIYTDISRKGVQKQYPVVACKDFNQNGYMLYKFRTLANSIMDIDMSGRSPKLENLEIIFSLDEADFKNTFRNLPQSEAENMFWDVFIIDALIGNFDRHAENCGYLYNRETDDMKFSPVYDCGACFFPKLADKVLVEVLSKPEEIKKRIYDYPNASLTKDGKKINYYQFINSLENKACNDALIRMYPRIDLQKIYRIIDGMELPCQERNLFYKRIVSERHECIIKRSYEKLNKQVVRKRKRR